MKKSTLAYIFSGLGAVPFLGLATLIFFQGKASPYFALSQALFMTYGAIILSFLAGIHWGFAIKSANSNTTGLLVSAVIVSLLAWSALLVRNLDASLIILLAGFAFMLIFDISLYKHKFFERWYIRLRIIISSLVFLSILMMLGAN